MIRARSWLLALGFVAASCAHAPPSAALPPTTIGEFHELLNWASMDAEHKVTIDFEQPNGTHERREIRGLLAIQRPNKLRLRAIGPGGLTIFDLIVMGDKIWVLDAVTKDDVFRVLVQSIGDDLRLAYQLLPTENDQKIDYYSDHAVITDHVRKVLLEDFRSVDGRAIFAKAHIESNAFKYKVDITVESAKLDVDFPPEMFQVQ